MIADGAALGEHSAQARPAPQAPPSPPTLPRPTPSPPWTGHERGLEPQRRGAKRTHRHVPTLRTRMGPLPQRRQGCRRLRPTRRHEKGNSRTRKGPAAISTRTPGIARLRARAFHALARAAGKYVPAPSAHRYERDSSHSMYEGLAKGRESFMNWTKPARRRRRDLTSTGSRCTATAPPPPPRS
jgi:hypothetical protein